MSDTTTQEPEKPAPLEVHGHWSSPIGQAVSTESTRYALGAVYLEPIVDSNGNVEVEGCWATATDSRQLAVTRQDGLTVNRPGLLPGVCAAKRHAECDKKKKTSTHGEAFEFSATPKTIRKEVGEADGRFPNTRQVAVPLEQSDIAAVFTIDPDILLKMANAIRDDLSNARGIEIAVQHDGTSAIYCLGGTRNFGVIMPLARDKIDKERDTFVQEWNDRLADYYRGYEDEPKAKADSDNSVEDTPEPTVEAAPEPEPAPEVETEPAIAFRHNPPKAPDTDRKWAEDTYDQARQANKTYDTSPLDYQHFGNEYLMPCGMMKVVEHTPDGDAEVEAQLVEADGDSWLFRDSGGILFRLEYDRIEVCRWREGMAVLDDYHGRILFFNRELIAEIADPNEDFDAWVGQLRQRGYLHFRETTPDRIEHFRAMFTGHVNDSLVFVKDSGEPWEINTCQTGFTFYPCDAGGWEFTADTGEAVIECSMRAIRTEHNSTTDTTQPELTEAETQTDTEPELVPMTVADLMELL